MCRGRSIHQSCLLQKETADELAILRQKIADTLGVPAVTSESRTLKRSS